MYAIKSPGDETGNVSVYDSGGNVIAIRHYQGKTPEILDALGEALSGSSENLYVHSGRVVRLIQRWNSESHVLRPDGALMRHHQPVQSSPMQYKKPFINNEIINFTSPQHPIQSIDIPKKCG